MKKNIVLGKKQKQKLLRVCVCVLIFSVRFHDAMKFFTIIFLSHHKSLLFYEQQIFSFLLSFFFSILVSPCGVFLYNYDNSVNSYIKDKYVSTSSETNK